MILQQRLKAQTPAWNNKQRYRVTQAVSHNGSYWVNTTGFNSEPTPSNQNWLFAGYLSPTGGGAGAITKLWKAITFTEDADFIQDSDFEGAVSIDVIQSSVAGAVTNGYTFDSASGTIGNYPVTAGETHVVFYTVA